MPKSQKQKKAKAADFVKAKLKLGKAKQPAGNATSTSFSAKPITLPNQKIRQEENTTVPTTRSHLTLDELVVRLRHYSPNTRKDALTGLRELLGAHPAIWRLNLGTIIHSCASLISDENPAVRKTLRAFFAWFLHRLDSALLKPFCSVIFFFSSSALSHIFPDIRVDAIHIIDILLEVAPDSLVAGYSLAQQSTNDPLIHSSEDSQQPPGVRLLRLYLSLLSIDSDSPALSGLSSTPTNQLTANSKLIVWKSLAKFITHATCLDTQQSESLSMPLWIFRSAFFKERDFEAFRALLTDPDVAIHENHMGHINNYNDTTCHMFERFNEAFLGSHVFQQSPANLPAHSCGPSSLVPGSDLNQYTSSNLLLAMQPAILSIFLDAAPTAFQSHLDCSISNTSHSGAPISPSLELVYNAITVLQRLWHAGMATVCPVGNHNLKSLETILTKMSPYFVFGADDLAPHGLELNHLLRNLNLMYCDLVSLLALAKPNSGHTLTVQLDRVGQYITNLLSDKAISAKSGPLHPQAYRGMLSIVWSLFRHDVAQSSANPVTWSDKVLQAFVDHWNTVAPSSELKYLGIDFLARLCIMDDLPGCQFACELNILGSETQDKLRQWMEGLPKLLWQLGHKSPATSHLVLAFLHRIIARPMAFFDASIATLPGLLVPFFASVHPASGRTIVGPYTRLPRTCQKLAQAIGWYLANHPARPHAIDGLTQALRKCDILF